MAIDKERHDKGERDFLYIVGAKLNESRRKKKLKQHDVVSMLEEKYQYKTSAQHISDLENGNGNLKLYEAAILCSISFLGGLLSVSYCAILGLALSSPIPIAIPSSFCVIPLNFRILLIFSPVLISCFSPFAANSLLEMRLHTILP